MIFVVQACVNHYGHCSEWCQQRISSHCHFLVRDNDIIEYRIASSYLNFELFREIVNLFKVNNMSKGWDTLMFYSD
jgi:hypothetical protein